MTKRVKSTKVGDIFEFVINSEEKRYLQYVISDMSQLNSDVVRVFKKKYPISSTPSLDTITNDNILFYTHCDTKTGIKKDIWKLYGNSQEVGITDDIYFRCPETTTNKWNPDAPNWFIWNCNEDAFFVRKLTKEQKQLPLGGVYPVDFVRLLILNEDCNSFPEKYWSEMEK